MRLSWSNVVSAVLMVCLVLSWARVAEGRPGPKNGKTPIDEFLRMSPAEQQQALNRLPPEKRRRLEERLERFNQLPRGQQQTLRNMYDRLNQLPPERQQAVRKSLNQFSQQPPERRQAMRQELRSMAPLDPQEREGRMASAEFQERFSEKEQRIVRDMSGLLPVR
jgi:predicted DNA-binding WGR domain protein